MTLVPPARPRNRNERLSRFYLIHEASPARWRESLPGGRTARGCRGAWGGWGARCRRARLGVPVRECLYRLLSAVKSACWNCYRGDG